MAAEKKGQTIVIKKIYVTAGHHGGSWKVALADFMTAMMAFFLVMWLLGQSEQTKKAVSDYFSTPSVIEYNFQNFGATLSLEKLFLDLISEPLKAFQTFLEPMEKSPNLLEMGSQKVVAAYMADKLGDLAEGVSVAADGYEFIFRDTEFFVEGTDVPRPEFAKTAKKVGAVVAGLEDATVEIQSMLFFESVANSSPELARTVAARRLAILDSTLRGFMDAPSNAISGVPLVQPSRNWVDGQGPRPRGLIKFTIRQKEFRTDGTKYRKLDRLFNDGKDLDMKAYREYLQR